MSSSYIWSSLYKWLMLWNLGATFRIVFLGHLWNQEKMLLQVAFSESMACSWFKKTRQMPLVLAGFTQWMFLTLACVAYLWNWRTSQWQSGECQQIFQTQKRLAWWVRKIPVQPSPYPHTTHTPHSSGGTQKCGLWCVGWCIQGQWWMLFGFPILSSKCWISSFSFGVQLLYNVVLVSAVPQSESSICICKNPLFGGFSSHLGHHRALSRVPWAME